MALTDDEIIQYSGYLKEGTFYNVYKQAPYTKEEFHQLRAYLGPELFDRLFKDALESLKDMAGLQQETIKTIIRININAGMTKQIYRMKPVTDEDRSYRYFRMKDLFESISEEQVALMDNLFSEDAFLQGVSNMRDFFISGTDGCFGGRSGMWQSITCKLKTYHSLLNYNSEINDEVPAPLTSPSLRK